MADSRIAAQLYTLRRQCQSLDDFARTLRRLRDIGYQAVQVSGIGPVDTKDVALALGDAGMTCAATHLDWRRFLDEPQAVIEQHKLWNCRHAAIGSLPQEYRDAAGIERFAMELVPVAERLAAEGIDFSYHNHSFEFARHGGRTLLEMLYHRVGGEHLKAEIDIYWVQHGGGDPVQWIRRCAGRIPLLHLKDMVIGPDTKQRYAEVGEGNLNWPDILAAAKEAGVLWYIVEQDECYDRDPFDSMAISYRNLKAMGID